MEGTGQVMKCWNNKDARKKLSYTGHPRNYRCNLAPYTDFSFLPSQCENPCHVFADRCLTLLVSLLCSADWCVGIGVVRNFCHDGYGQPVALPLMAGQGVSLSCADNDVPHVLEGRIYAGDLQMQGESFVSQQIMLLFGQSSTTVAVVRSFYIRGGVLALTPCSAASFDVCRF